jgi:hypothetical protein
VFIIEVEVQAQSQNIMHVSPRDSTSELLTLSVWESLIASIYTPFTRTSNPQ